METSNKLVVIFSLSALGISLLTLFGFHDILFSPNITIGPVFDEGNKSTTMMFVNVWNHGNAPATNVRITLNPNYHILSKKLEYSAEDTTIQDRGSNALVVFSPRLSEGERIAISNVVDASYNDTQYDIYVTYDQGKKIQYSTTLQGKIHFPTILIRTSETPSSWSVTTDNPSVKITRINP